MYELLPTSEPKPCALWDDETTSRDWRYRISSTVLYMLLEAFVLVPYSFYTTSGTWGKPNQFRPPNTCEVLPGLSKLSSRSDKFIDFDLEKYNKTTFFTENIDLMQNSDTADRFSSKIQDSTHSKI